MNTLWRIGLLLVLAVVTISAWRLTDPPVSPSAVLRERFDWLAYSPYDADARDPRVDAPSRATVAADLAVLAEHTRGVRLYRSGMGHEVVVEEAAKRGLSVVAGAWLNGDPVHDAAEITAAADLAKRYRRTVKAVLVGNETILRTEATPAYVSVRMAQLQSLIDQPVSTAEPWHIWREYPELVRQADFLAVHILPYWEGMSARDSVGDTATKYDLLATAFPGKRIFVAEAGWPSRGETLGYAEATPAAQTEYLSGMVEWARRSKVDFAIMEAIDQPWKYGIEGRAGAYWGVFNADRSFKFGAAAAPTDRIQGFFPMAAAAIGLLLTAAYLVHRPRVGFGRLLMVGFIGQGVGLMLAWTFWQPGVSYFAGAHWVIWALGIGMQLVLAGLVFATLVSLAELWVLPTEAPRAPVESPVPGAPRRPLKVSIHVPCRNEPIDMLAQTIAALNRVDFPDLDILVVDNNSSDDYDRDRLAAICAQHGPRTRFISLRNWPGFKAGALNEALRQTASDVDVIGVIDSDYQVDAGWLSRALPHFLDSKVGFVQGPQDYADGGEGLFKRAIFWEYAAFFTGGMSERAVDNAIIQHGTMTLVRRTALENVGNWGEGSITEDADLGLRLQEAGWQGVYLPISMGKGVMPDDFAAYRMQRVRWSFGGLRIMMDRAGFFFGKSGLNWRQRYHYLAGWLPWVLDGLGAIAFVLALGWSAAMIAVPQLVPPPEAWLVLPALAAALLRGISVVAIQMRRARIRLIDALLASWAGLGLSPSAGLAALQAIAGFKKPFKRTPKKVGRGAMGDAFASVRVEALGAALGLAVVVGLALRLPVERFDSALWVAAMSMMTLPFLAAVTLALTAAIKTDTMMETLGAPVGVDTGSHLPQT